MKYFFSLALLFGLGAVQVNHIQAMQKPKVSAISRVIGIGAIIGGVVCCAAGIYLFPRVLNNTSIFRERRRFRDLQDERRRFVQEIFELLSHFRRRNV